MQALTSNKSTAGIAYERDRPMGSYSGTFDLFKGFFDLSIRYFIELLL